MRLIFAAALLLTLACTTVPPEDGGSSGQCSAEAIGDLVGRPASEALGAEAMRRSGARRLRWIRPGDVITMDYSTQRLNIRLDGRNNVESFTCG
jgi:hypothetical protein